LTVESSRSKLPESLQRGGISRVAELVRTQVESFGFLFAAGGKSCHLGAKRARELNRQMAEAANANHPNA
jgi:hypothetical protein